jgi:hypothetical protein
MECKDMRGRGWRAIARWFGVKAYGKWKKPPPALPGKKKGVA